MMKAVVYQTYGPPEVLRLQQVAKPAPKANEILIKIHATTVTAGDWRVRKADPFMVRLFFGLTKPKNPILGHEFAGEVVDTGKDVTRFAKGDLVFGSTGTASGTYAEYLTLPEDGTIANKPDNLSFEEAAAVPVGALTALFFLKQADIQPGQKVLIHGASGSVGTAAVQLAKYFGAEVTGVTSARNAELVKSLGADQVIDYKTTDFSKTGETYDVIMSTVGKASYAQSKKALKPTGIFLTNDGAMGDYFQMLWSSVTGGHKVIAGLTEEGFENFLLIRDLLEQGKFKPVVDRTYSLEEMPEAHRYVETGRKRGNVVVTVES